MSSFLVVVSEIVFFLSNCISLNPLFSSSFALSFCFIFYPHFVFLYVFLYVLLRSFVCYISTKLLSGLLNFLFLTSFKTKLLTLTIFTIRFTFSFCIIVSFTQALLVSTCFIPRLIKCCIIYSCSPHGRHICSSGNISRATYQNI